MQTKKHEKLNAAISLVVIGIMPAKRGNTEFWWEITSILQPIKAATEDISICVAYSHLIHISSLKVFSLSIPISLGKKGI